MSLWNALTGSTYRWNTTKSSANRDICIALRSLTSSGFFAPFDPIKLRNLLYSQWLITSSAIFRLDGPFESHKDKLQACSVSDLKTLAAAFNYNMIIAQFFNDDKSNIAITHILLSAMNIMYCKTTDHMESWLEAGDWERQGDIMWRLHSKSQREVEKTFSVTESIFDTITIAPVLCYLTEAANKTYSRPDWNDIVSQELSSH
jgi:hypothetical protein